ncbi:hypothetical protein SBF1_110014 [Candidatus Desulfosporosinus infrequens]|uniref:Uncharacterized protein n=1 Tax=Candidatus Desulfosporosinus infrequens TaxID=2043169 RepID=A0A2U3JX25_9FIRM|nr:hypothetical protein SBF1_110014 [Candidatus Desulfosporosinus infrequens]
MRYLCISVTKNVQVSDALGIQGANLITKKNPLARRGSEGG